MKTYNLKCEILSPVHIGSGQEIDPLNYVIENGTFYKISMERFIFSMSATKRLEFESVLKKNDLMGIRTFVSDNFNKAADAVYSEKVSPRIETLYKSKLGDVQNQLLVSPFIRTQGDAVPLFPGSSLKGSIRTAVISEFTKKKELQSPKNMRDEYEFESKVLGYRDAKDDPFRAIKIRDALLENNAFMVREIRNVSKGRNGGLQANDIQMICEVSQSSMTGSPVIFETEICIDDGLIATRYLSKGLLIEEISACCKSFYRDKIEKEHNKFYKNSAAQMFSEQLLGVSLDSKSFLLRIGRFSGVESVTLDNYRNPRSPRGKGWGGTRNLAEGIYPMGWIKATVFE